MKKLLYLLFVLSFSAYAQVPEKINYQGVARNSAGNILPQQNIGLKFSVHSTSANGPVVYSETHATTTDDFGLFSLFIGGGTIVSGTFNSIDWGNDLFFLQVEMDATGGTSYLDMGTSQLVSVPYALYAKTSGATVAINGTPGHVPIFNQAGNGIEDSNTMVNGPSGNFGIGTTTPAPDAIVDISATDRGIIIPRMNTAQRNAIQVYSEGLLVYDVDTHSFWYYNGTAWVGL